jgi:hypothetical protein
MVRDKVLLALPYIPAIPGTITAIENASTGIVLAYVLIVLPAYLITVISVYFIIGTIEAIMRAIKYIAAFDVGTHHYCTWQGRTGYFDGILAYPPLLHYQKPLCFSCGQIHDSQTGESILSDSLT